MPLTTALRELVTRRVNPRPVAVARIGVGIAAVLKAVERMPVLDRLNDPELIRVPYLAGQPSLLDLPVGLVVAAWLLMGIAFTLGAATSLTGTGLALLLGAVMLSDQQLYSNHLYLLIWLVGLLTLARSGTALSVDSWRAGERASIPAWSVALLQLQIVVVYFWAGVSKVNLEYLSGSVVASSLRPDGFLAVPVTWKSFELMAVASILSIIAELGLVLGLVLPRWRRTAFVVGLGLHLSIAIWLMPTAALVIFGLMTLAPYILFVPPDRHRLAVVWDDSCGFCSRWVTWFRRLDWLRVLHFVPGSDAATLTRLEIPREDADRALQLVRDGHRTQGFDAVIGVMEHLPLSFLWAPLLRLWPILPLGRWTYGRVAARRQCSLNPPGRRAAT